MCCSGPIARQDHESAHRDTVNAKAAIAASKPIDAVMPAASPGVVSHVPAHIGTTWFRRLDRRDASALQGAYGAFANAGTPFSSDSPDLAMARTAGLGFLPMRKV